MTDFWQVRFRPRSVPLLKLLSHAELQSELMRDAFVINILD